MFRTERQRRGPVILQNVSPLLSLFSLFLASVDCSLALFVPSFSSFPPRLRMRRGFARIRGTHLRENSRMRRGCNSGSQIFSWASLLAYLSFLFLSLSFFFIQEELGLILIRWKGWFGEKYFCKSIESKILME